MIVKYKCKYGSFFLIVYSSCSCSIPVCVPSVVLFAASSEWIKCIYSRVVPALFLKHQTEVDSVFNIATEKLQDIAKHGKISFIDSTLYHWLYHINVQQLAYRFKYS